MKNKEKFVPGIWLVQDNKNCKSKQHVLYLGELENLYPYVEMSQDIDDLTNFIVQWKRRNITATISIDSSGKVSASLPSACEEAKATLKFLAMTKDERKRYLSTFNESYRYVTEYRNGNSVLRDGTGKIVKDRPTKSDIVKYKNNGY